MKGRIIEALVTFSSGRSIELSKLVCDDLNIDAEELQKRSKEVLKSILHNYSEFSVTTIDSFFSNIIRSMSRELNLSQRFNIELDTKLVIEKVAVNLLDDITINTKLRSWLEEFIVYLIEDEKSWNLLPEIEKMGHEIIKDRYHQIFGPEGIGSIEESFIPDLMKIKYHYVNGMRALGRKFTDVMQKSSLTHQDFAYKGQGNSYYFTKIQSEGTYDKYTIPKRLQNIINSDGNWATKKSEHESLIKSLSAEYFDPIALETIQFHEKYFYDFNTSNAILTNVYLSGIINQLNQKLKEYRDREEMVLISDTTSMLNRAMGNSDAPFIFEKTGNKYQHFMLDEFQDTSSLQWKNMIPLVTNGLSNGHYSMIVGDVKQSIYRWRGGDMNLLLEKVDKDLHAFKSMIDHKYLNNNYRSRETVVKFNNWIFPQISNLIRPVLTDPWQRLLDFAYSEESVHQNNIKGGPGEGFVEIALFNTLKSSGGTDGSDDDLHWKEHALKKLTESIRTVKKLGYSFKDICILVRTNNEAVEIISHLRTQNINQLLSSEAMHIGGSTNVRFILSLLKLSLTPKEKNTLAHVSYFISTELNSDKSAKGLEFSTELPTEYNLLISSIRLMSPYEAIEEIGRITGLTSYPDPYLQKLIEVAIEFDRSESEGISGFLDWYEQNKEKDACSVIIPSSSDAIKIMTIHKAKGLEFPVVYMPFAKWDVHKNTNSIKWMGSRHEKFNQFKAYPLRSTSSLEFSYFDDEYHDDRSQDHIDNINLLYVAFTRAAEKLYIYSAASNSKKENTANNVGSIIKEVMELNSYFELAEDNSQVKIFRSGDENNIATHDKKEPSSINILEINSWAVSSWRNKLWSVLNKDQVSISDKNHPETDYGKRFHHIMSLYGTEWINESELATLINDRFNENADQEQLKKAGICALQFIENMNWTKDDYKIMTEVEILKKDGKTLRPDLVLLSKDHAIIVDYKTGLISSQHHEQLLEYSDGIKEIGIAEVDSFLIYTGTSKLVKVA